MASVSPRPRLETARRPTNEARFSLSTAALLVLSAALTSGNGLARPWFPQPIKWVPSDAMGIAVRT